ncbi:hypothetical protein CC1G_00429 [Coprinopsis cinerea okayama7|uniref:Uncharacterized protein n=1 Tax=Coprinopsis cinerea (strain Okayama-7 / 130 / ATCC MYA-4618 / FGSC 9003) TaxID=240176 RepID=A8NXX1_COPC7|nr:hypothetical protein CC1G_00429 [Coprinopsis cinerea okayama7\|eukprot:XP_001837293.1 hypothetical protein CC1G_00429 [Coprinopsis cinerea okayama7\
MSPSNILDPAALISLLPTILPSDSKTLSSSHDALAALLHTVFTALAFRLTAVNDVPAATTGNVLPEEWKKNGPGHYSFNYRHEQSSLEFAVTVAKLGSRTVINAIALESDKVASLDVATQDFTSPSFYPYDQLSDPSKSLVHGFISSNRVSDLVTQFKLKIIQKLLPGLQKEGYSEGSETVSGESSAPTTRDPPPAQPRPGPPPDAPEIPYRTPPTFPSRNPLEVGRSDLDPFPRNPFAPPLFPPTGGDGMFVGPNHPMFGIHDRDRDIGRGPWGGDGYLPPLGAPPGARFDPVGPTFPNRPPRGPTGPYPPPGGRNTRDPDNDEFMPPGMGDMFS